MPVGLLLIVVSGMQQSCLLKCGASSWTPIGKPRAVNPQGMERPVIPARLAVTVYRSSQVHRQRIVELSRRAERRRGRRGADQQINLLKRVVIIVTNQAATFSALR